MTEILLYVDGVWRRGSTNRWGAVTNPATEGTIGRVSHASGADVQCAIEAATRAFRSWRHASLEERASILRETARLLRDRTEGIAQCLTTEQGKPLREARSEVERASATFAWHGEVVHRVCASRPADDGASVIQPEPIGVVAALTPWNYPAVIIARKLAAALAAGCTVVLKAAEETPSTAVAIVAALEDAGLPAGVVNLVFGDPPAIAGELLDAPAVRAISFTGSTRVGKQLAEFAGRTLKRCVLELGGHAPVLVLEDADVEVATRAIAEYKFECAGQSCNAPSRIYVQAPVFDDFVDAFTSLADRLCVGDGADPTTEMGPLATRRRLDAVERLAADALERGARLNTGGRRIDRAGWFWPPTVLTEMPAGAALLCEEPFGPLLPIWPFATLDEGIARANANPYGLAAYVFTDTTTLAQIVARDLAAGSIGINELRGVPPDVGIAGIKDSGYGYEGGEAGVEAFLNLKVVRGAASRGAS